MSDLDLYLRTEFRQPRPRSRVSELHALGVRDGISDPSLSALRELGAFRRLPQGFAESPLPHDARAELEELKRPRGGFLALFGRLARLRRPKTASV